MAIDGIIFDLDGTLVDTNDLHVRAWAAAFEDYGYRVGLDRLAVEVGKGGDRLVPAVLGDQAETADGAALRRRQQESFADLADSADVRLFAGTTDLLDACRARGLRVALATGSNAGHLDMIHRAADIDFAQHVDAIITADDAPAGKPAPDLVLAAADRLALHPAQCAMVGDTPFDATAAKLAGVIAIGVGCSDQIRLLAAGARLVCADPADLLGRLDAVLQRASPARVHFTTQRLAAMMQPALTAAEAALAGNDAPIGAALFDGDGNLLASAHNEMGSSGNKTAHAEIVAFARAAGQTPLEARDLLLMSTLEPCVMCTGAAMESAVDTVVYGLRAPDDAGTSRVNPPTSPESQMPRIVGHVRADESRALLQTWLARNRDNPQAAYVAQLLGEPAPRP